MKILENKLLYQISTFRGGELEKGMDDLALESVQRQTLVK